MIDNNTLTNYDNPAVEIYFTKNQTLNWYPSDTEELYKKNVKKLGKQWKYYNVNITYKFNSLGYRCMEPSDIKNKKYFLTFGCSHTLGMGLPIEDTYSNIISQKLKMNYLNYGVGGGAQNLLWTNTVLAVKNLKHTPRFVVYQWPEIERFNSFGKDLFLILNPGCNFSKYPSQKKLYENLLQEKHYFYNTARTYFDSVNLLWTQKGVQVIHFALSKEVSDFFGISLFDFNTDPIEKARDLHHPGIKQNLQYADYVLSQLS